MNANDDAVPFPPPPAPVAEARAVRLGRAAMAHVNDPAVVAVALDVGRVLLERARAADLDPFQAVALAARLGASLALVTHSELRLRNPGDPDLADLEAFRIAYEAMAGHAFEDLAPLLGAGGAP